MSINIYRREREGGRAENKRQLRQLSTAGDSLGSEIAFGKFAPPTSCPASAAYCVCQSHTGERVTSAYKKQLEKQLGGFPSDFCC